MSSEWFAVALIVLIVLLGWVDMQDRTDGRGPRGGILE